MKIMNRKWWSTVPCKKTRFFGYSLSKWGHFERAKPTLKILLTSWLLVYLFKRFRSFNAETLGSLNQRAQRRPPTLTAGNFKALWSKDPKFLALIVRNLLKKHTKNQEASSILKVGFALSKWPHLHREWPKKRVFLQGAVC